MMDAVLINARLPAKHTKHAKNKAGRTEARGQGEPLRAGKFEMRRARKGRDGLRD